MKRSDEEIKSLITKEAKKKAQYVISYRKKNKQHLNEYSRKWIQTKRRSGKRFAVLGYILPSGTIDVTEIYIYKSPSKNKE